MTPITDNRIIDLAVSYLMSNGDNISYELLDMLFHGRIIEDEENTAALLVAATVIVHNIPVRDKDTNAWVQRALDECYRGLITFWKANTQEKFVVHFSADNNKQDILCRVLPALSFLNTNHDRLQSGFGERKPDLIDTATNTTYEVKSNYKKHSSVSGLHDANRLIDCDGTHLVVYPILYDGSVAFDNALYRFPNVIPDTVLTYRHAISESLLAKVKTGELIHSIEEALAKSGFIWNT